MAIIDSLNEFKFEIFDLIPNKLKYPVLYILSTVWPKEIFT